MLRFAQDLLQKLRGAFEEDATVYMMQFQASVSATGDKVTKEWADGMYRPNSFKNPLFQGESTVEACMNELCMWWQKPLAALLASVNKHANGHIASTFRNRKLPAGFIDAMNA